MKRLQHAKSARREECKAKTLQRVKVQHEMVQYIKRVLHEKKCNMKRRLHKKVQYEDYTKMKIVQYEKCNMKKVQREKYILPQ